MSNKFHYLVGLLCSLTLLLAFSSSGFAQKTVKGKVTSSADNAPVIGATVQLVGTQKGTITNDQGNYSIEVPGKENESLQFSYVGFNNKQVTIGNQSTLNVSLEPSASSLNELVVTGYQSQRKADITGAVSTVDAKQLTSVPEGSAEQQMQGRVSGVTIITSGQPGTSSQVRIRGYGSFTNNNPLYVVDGVPTYDISNINSNDIETMTVLKDAGSASIYGARAAAGVVLITTKKGTPGKLSVSYHGTYGWQFPGNGYSLLNPQESADWVWKAYQNADQDPASSAQAAQYGSGSSPVLPDYLLAGTKYGVSANDPAVNPDLYDGTYVPATGHLAYQIIKANKAGTNWYNEVTRVAPIQNQSVSFAGGTENAIYNVSFDYFNQQGIIQSTYLKRYTLRANTAFTVKDRVKIGENLELAVRDNPTLGGGDFQGNQSEGNAIAWTYRENPLIPVYDIMGNWAGTYAKGFNNPENPVANQVRAKDNKGYVNYFFGNVYAEVTLPYYLKFRSSFGGYYFNYYYTTYGWRTYENAEPVTNFTVNEGGGYGRGWTWTNTLNFDHKFGDHQVTVLAGVESIKEGIGQNINGSGLNPFSWDLLYRSISTTQQGGRTVSDAPGVGYRLFSYFGKLDYNYADKYLVSGTFRRDGSSNFGVAKRYGVFPAFTAGWRISNENFMKHISWLTDLKIRGSWGQMGNQQAVPNTNQYSLFGTNPTSASYDITGSNTSVAEGLLRTNLPNAEGHWETNITTNVGFDATLFNGTFLVVVDLFDKKTKDLLFNPPVEATVGYFSSYPYINVGSMDNKGIDVQLEKFGDMGKDFHYDVNLTFTSYHNKITHVANVDYFDGNSFGSGRLSGPVARNQVGHPISAFFGYKVAGLWQSQSEIDAADAEAQKATHLADATYQSGGEHPGEFRYVDVNGDGQITTDDRTFLGDPNPKFTSGLNISLEYKKFDFKVFLYESYGNDAFAYTKWFTDFFPSFPGGAISSRVADSWTPQHTNTSIPIYENIGSFSTNQIVNSYYVEKGSYMRCKNLELGYNFSKGVLEKAGITNLRFYVQAVNLFTITKFDGLDPELTGYDTNFGVDYGNYPVVKQFLLGVDLNF